jgi:hypothetical protein
VRAPLVPRVVASDIHPPRTLVASRLHTGSEAWLPFGERVLDMMAANSVPYAGELPILCAASCATPAVDGLLARAGHLPPPHRVRYRGAAALREQLRLFGAKGYRVMAHHIPRADWLDDAACVVPRSLLVELNDKANLQRFVPAPAVPQRQVWPASALSDAPPASLSAPVVLKACTELPTGGGFDVLVCADAAGLERGWAAWRPRAAEMHAVVAERWMPFERSWCANVAIAKDEIIYLGAAEQICSAEGRWLGNFCGEGCEAPAAVEALAMQIARAGQSRGYVGFAGFDILPWEGRLLAIDINFRPCGSLLQVLFHESICARSGRRTTRNWRAETALPLEEAAKRLGPFLDDGRLAPMQAYDGAEAGDPSSSIGGYVAGRDRDEIASTIEALNRLLAARVSEPTAARGGEKR